MSRLVYGWLTALVAALPLRLGYGLAWLFAGLHYAAFPARRHAALANLASILPGSSRRERARIVKRMMRSYNEMLFEFFRLPHLDRDELLGAVEVVGREHVEAALAGGRGAIFASTHIGNWELGAVVVAHWGHTLHAVAGVQLNRWLAPAVRDTKTELAIRTVSVEDGFRKLLRALDRNEIVALMVDGDMYRHGVTVEFFGRETPFPAGPGVLSLRTGAPILCAFCERTGAGRFRVVIEPAIDPSAHASVQEVNAAVARAVERHIRDHVDQWCIFRPFWDGPPAEQGSAAARAHRVHV
jgi:KDO2-lipid IV(A) lauroyltransferase